MYFFGDIFFETLLLKNVFQIVFIIFLATECLIFWITTFLNLKSKGKKKHDGGSCFILIVGCIFSIWADAFFRRGFGLQLPIFFFWIGCMLTIFGIGLRVYAVLKLKRSFTVSVQVQSNQKIIKTGPYKCIRHPAYSGSVISLLGIALCFRSILGIIASILIIRAIYGHRVGLAEKVLEKNFGDEYKEYEKTTWRIVPYIW